MKRNGQAARGGRTAVPCSILVHLLAILLHLRRRAINLNFHTQPDTKPAVALSEWYLKVTNSYLSVHTFISNMFPSTNCEYEFIYNIFTYF
jgi:hypothetical protein